MALLAVQDLVKHFPVRGGVLGRVVARVHALNGVSFALERGESVGLVGESGCGKSTLAKCILRLHDATAGSIRLDGHELSGLGHAALMPFRRRMQIVFQDPWSSLDPRRTVRSQLAEVLRFHRIVPAQRIDERVAELLARVGLRPESAERLPHELSGGQRQRVAIARALAVEPALLVADEPVSALDVSIQAQVLNLLLDLRQELGLTLLLASHDLTVVEHLCDRVLVMHLGFLVEELACDDLRARARHPYTRALLAASPVADPRERGAAGAPGVPEPALLEGDVPDPRELPPGCAFASRCPLVMERCRQERPPLEPRPDGQRVACFAAD